MFIYTSVGNVLVASKVYRNCVVQVNGVAIIVDLIPSDLQKFDVILGTDFLSKYRASMDCYRKEVVFRYRGEVVVFFKGNKKILPTCMISTIKARKLLSKGCMAYLAYVIDTQVNKLKPEDILIVQELLDVFAEELLGLLPDREVEFSIDLIPGTTPISQAPCRMAPTKLKELKT